MRILHVSDLHGIIPTVTDDSWDVMVNTGDWQPTKGRNVMIGERIKPRRELWHQAKWIYNNADEIIAWMRGRPMIFVPGNHDYYNPVTFLRNKGANIIDANQKLIEVDGFKFYGFPFIPFHPHYDDFPEWNWQIPEREIAAHFARVPRNIDVLACHCPPAGTLDGERGRNFGSQAIADGLQEWDGDLPTLYLCGHVHASHGMSQWYEMTLSNAATTGHFIDLRPRDKMAVENTGQLES